MKIMKKQHRLKKNLVALNKLIQTTDIKIEGDPLGRDYFYRVFNRGSFKLGGRFYSIKLTNLKKEKRKKITANGVPLIELDFKQMQPSLLLNSLRKKLNGDIYHFGNDFKLETVPKGRYKEIAKTEFLIMLNTRRKKDAICTIDYDLQEKGIAEKYGSIIVDTLIKRNKNIETGLFKDSGIKFMNIESQIAEKVIMHFINKGKIIIPIHDAFLVTKADEEELKAIMISAYNQVIMEHYGMISVPPEVEQK